MHHGKSLITFFVLFSILLNRVWFIAYVLLLKSIFIVKLSDKNNIIDKFVALPLHTNYPVNLKSVFMLLRRYLLVTDCSSVLSIFGVKVVVKAF